MTSNKISERRLAENQVYFRQPNERIVKGFVELKEVAEAEGHQDWLPDINQPVSFYCECSDEKCTKRISLTPSNYKNSHKNPRQFTVLPGHNLPKIEKIVQSSSNYVVVEKYETPPQKVDKPAPSGLDHS